MSTETLWAIIACIGELPPPPASPALRPASLTSVAPVTCAVLFCLLVSWRNDRAALREKHALDAELAARRQAFRARVRDRITAGAVTRVQTDDGDVPPAYGDSWEDAKLECALDGPAPSYPGAADDAERGSTDETSRDAAHAAPVPAA